jgi:cell division septal protein FtsQ
MEKKKNSSKRRTIPQFNILVGDGVSYKDIIKDENLEKYVLNETVSSIKDSIEKNKKYAILLNLSKDGYDVEIPRENWKDALSNPLRFYENKEMYEKCDEIIKLINVL